MAQKYIPQDRVPLPPPDAKVYTTACDYCIVGCGYRVFTWPEGTEGGPRANENALGQDMPTSAFQGWISPNQHNFTMIDGQRHHVVVQPDPDTEVVNRRGNHSIRGGTLALKVFNPDGPTSDRLKTPMLRVNEQLTPVSWDDAFEIMAQIEKVSRVCKPDLKLFIGESITGNDSIEQVKSFDWAIGIDGIILTKADVDEKGGTALSLGYVTKKPILFLGTGQEYDEIEVFDKSKFLKELGL